ncbi:helix-turn-helix transcriptional regulator [Pseudomonas sp. C27(2019)]|uniref:LuxR C-terminal-related transcriptional regulator n=1 Tax=Pseudomonas sp. C27(2019) TaxID=2604941 RepID=UPI0012441518|nr:LuxR C-terminal-related transcriptional regulator [Pseudomonas sp. C27(2019)]QEY59245.1 helix-turn-helix transcriptional regulator [Pseudomonas sp. C27(2019)]
MSKRTTLRSARAEQFYRPPVPNGYVARSRLYQRLRAGLQGRLILVCAPAGCGKSALSSAFCDQLPAPWRSVWLSLSARDSDPGRFFERFLNAVHSVYPDVGEQALAQLKTRQGHQAFPYEAWLNTVLDEISTDLNADSPLLLVLDDYHLAQNEVLDNNVQYLLNHLPAGFLLLVTSRQRPSWHLARLRLSDLILEINEQDLGFNPAELHTLLAEQGYTEVSDAIVQNILQRSEGWAAGLRLWLLALNGRVNNEYALLAGPHGSQGLIRDYVLEEIIAQQPESIQQFLFATATLERFHAGLCDALRERQDSAQVIEYLLAHHVFLVPLDEQGEWYRYHHLFSDALLVQQAAATDMRTVHARASAWFAEHDMLNEAVEYALLAEQPEIAAQLVQGSAEELLLAEQNISMLLRWKMDLPDGVLASTPRLIVLYCWALGLACQLDAADQLLAQLAKFLPAPSQAEQIGLLAQWQALSGLLARGRGDAQLAWQYCSEALLNLPVERHGQRQICTSILGSIAILRGDILQARQLARDNVELAQRVGCPLYTGFALYERARVLQLRGQIHRALAVVREGLKLLVDMPRERVYAVRARLTMYEGYLLGMRGRSQEARVKLCAGISEAQACRDASVLIGYRMQAILEGVSGRVPEAFAQLAEAERVMHTWDVPSIYYLAMLTLSKCELWLLQGQVELAQPWLERLSTTYNVQHMDKASEFHPQLALYVELQMALLERALGQVTAAEQRLRGLIEYARQHDCVVIEQTARVYLCVLLLEQGANGCAAKQLTQALQLAQGGAVLAFQPLLSQHAAWLRQQLGVRAQDQVRDDLLAALPEAIEQALVGEQLVQYEALSARELAVLQLIAQGCSNQEVSDKLFISLHTVKTHARNINLKLGVERRTQAVARAQALGVLS